MRLFKNLWLESVLKSTERDKVVPMLAGLSENLTPKQERLLIDGGAAEEISCYIKRFFWDKTTENYFFRHVSDKLRLQYLQRCFSAGVSLKDRTSGATIIGGVNRDDKSGANHELIMQLLYLMQVTSFRLDEAGELNLVWRDNEQELLVFINQTQFLSAKAENEFLRTVSSDLVKLYSKNYRWHDNTVICAIRDNWPLFKQYGLDYVSSSEGEITLLMYGDKDTVEEYIAKHGLLSDSLDYLVKSGAEGNDAFNQWLKRGECLSLPTFEWLLKNDEAKAVAYLSSLKANLSKDEEDALLSDGTTSEVKAYVGQHCLRCDSFKMLLNRNVQEETSLYFANYDLSVDQFLVLLSRGAHEEILTYVSLASRLSPTCLSFLIGRGNTEEIQACLKNKHCKLSSEAVLAIKMRGVLNELELLPDNK